MNVPELVADFFQNLNIQSKRDAIEALLRLIHNHRIRPQAHSDKWNSQVVRYGGVDNKGLTAWSNQLDLITVKSHSIQIKVIAEEPVHIALAVTHVSDDRVAEMLEVASNLVQTSRERDGIHKCPSIPVSNWMELGNSVNTWAVLFVWDGMIELAPCSHWTSDQSQISFSHTIHLSLKVASYVTAQCEDKNTTGASIQAMNGEHRSLDERISDDISHSYRIIVPAAMDNHPGRFVHCDEVIILIYDCEIRRILEHRTFNKRVSERRLSSQL